MGYIWLATDKGISKYDGYQFQTFTIQDGLPSNDIRELFVDSDNRVWLIGSGKELVFIKNDQLQKVKTPHKSINIKPKGIHEYQKILWIDTDKGLFSYEKNRLKPYEISDSTWEFLGIDTAGVKWFYDENAILYPDGDKNKALPIPLNEEESLDGRIFQWSDGFLYFKTDEQLYFYKDSLIAVKHSSSVPLSAQRAPYLVSRRNIQSLNKKQALQLDYRHQGKFKLYGIFRDREDNWWFNTRNNGVYLLTGNAQLAQTYTIENGLDDPIVTASIKDRLGNLFLGTENGDLYIINQDDKTPMLFPLANARNINKLLIDDRFLYIGTKEGLHLLSLDNFNYPMFGFGITSDLSLIDCSPPSCIIKKNAQNFQISGNFSDINDLFLYKNKLFVASENGIWQLILDNASVFTGQQITAEPAQSVVVYNNEIWAGTKNGILKFDLEAPKIGENAINKFKYPVNHIALGIENDLWIGSDGYGIFHFKNKKLHQLPSTERDIIEQIIKDETNNLWAATSQGIKRILKKDEEYKIRAYKVIDGLPTKQINSIFSDKRNIYIGTNQGFTILNKIRLSKNNVRPPIFITNVSVNNLNEKPKPKFSLHYKENNITIEYVGISVKSNKELTYLHKMQGIDRKWQTTQATQLSYRGLSTGRYIFHIKAIDVEGKSSEERVVSFYIRPPYWETWWFYTLIIASSLALVYFFTQRRIQNIEKRAQEKAKIQEETNALQLKVAEEKAEIERVNNELARSKLETLQAQMNPHFAYNALTSIQKLILKKDNKTANRYLVKFARLMRQFLEASAETYIPLDKEIELLQLYIEMEQLRFKDKFAVTYEIDPMVKLHEVPIPSMLLQVFIENAINHGLVYKEGNGMLTFKVYQKEQAVWCVIEDDGIGRKKGQEIKKESKGVYKGLGMKISQERVKYLNMMEEVNVKVQIEDDILENGNGGTRVNVIVNYNLNTQGNGPLMNND